MNGDETGNHWFFRIGGVVTSAAWDVDDPTPMLRANGYAKLWRGLDLSDYERAAVDTGTPDRPLSGVAGNIGRDVMLGAIARHRPDLLETLDRLALDLAAVLGLPEAFAWGALSDYAAGAQAVTLDEMGLAGADEPEPEGLEPEADAMAPDGGPEGWSQVPPADPAHGCHPSRRQGA